MPDFTFTIAVGGAFAVLSLLLISLAASKGKGSDWAPMLVLVVVLLSGVVAYAYHAQQRALMYVTGAVTLAVFIIAIFYSCMSLWERFVWKSSGLQETLAKQEAALKQEQQKLQGYAEQLLQSCLTEKQLLLAEEAALTKAAEILRKETQERTCLFLAELRVLQNRGAQQPTWLEVENDFQTFLAPVRQGSPEMADALQYFYGQGTWPIRVLESWARLHEKRAALLQQVETVAQGLQL